MLRAARPTPPVLVLLNSLTIGGSETKSVRMANALAERGSDVTVAYLNPPEQLRPKSRRSCASSTCAARASSPWARFAG